MRYDRIAGLVGVSVSGAAASAAPLSASRGDQAVLRSFARIRKDAQAAGDGAGQLLRVSAGPTHE